jgi:hypothetical protein
MGQKIILRIDTNIITPKGGLIMQRLMVTLLLAMLLSLTGSIAALAEHGGGDAGEPVAGCQNKFHLHMAHDHHHDGGDHQHVGNDTDRNGDGWICARHVTPNGSVHVHTDNNVPFK